MKMSRLVKCLKDYKTFKEGHIYPVCGDNNGSHVIGVYKTGDPFSLLCYDYSDNDGTPVMLCDAEYADSSYDPIFEEYTLSLNTLRDAIYQDAVEHGLWEEHDQKRKRDAEFCAKCPQYAFDLDVESRLDCAMHVCRECVELREARDDADAFAEELADVIIMSMSVAGKLASTSTRRSAGRWRLISRGRGSTENDLPMRQCAADRIQRRFPLPGDLPGMRTTDALARRLACGDGRMEQE